MTWREFAFVEGVAILAILISWVGLLLYRASLRTWVLGWSKHARAAGLQIHLERFSNRFLPPIAVRGTYNGRAVEVRAHRERDAGRIEHSSVAAYWVEVKVGSKRGKPVFAKGKHRGRRLIKLLDRTVGDGA